MIRLALTLALLVFGYAALAGGAQEASESWTRLESARGRYVVEYRVVRGELAFKQLFDLEVRVTSTTEPGERPLHLSVDARMPHHGHGMRVKPTIDQPEPGRFLVRGMRLQMPGDWELSFDVRRGSVVERSARWIEVD